MTPQVQLSSAETSFLVHATEDPDRTLEVVSKTLRIPVVSFQRWCLEGHFGNPMSLFKGRLLGSDADNLFVLVFTSLNSEKRYGIDRYVDEHGVLHLRIDKQLLFQEKICLSQVDAVKIKFKPRFKQKSYGDLVGGLLLQ